MYRELYTEESLKKIQNSDNYRICIFGFGQRGKLIKKYLKDNYPDQEIVFCDNSQKVRKDNYGENIYTVEEIARQENIFIILGSKLYPESMLKQLHSLEVDDYRILSIEWDVVDELMFEDNKHNKMTPLSKIQFEVDLAEHCNLNCKYCSQFSPIAKEKYYDLNQYINDMERMSFIFNGCAERIYLIGGEPLLNKNVIDFANVARKNFPETDISIFTNGLLLFNKKEDFWSCIKDNNINIIVTKYPVKADYDAMEKLVEAKGVKFTFFKYSEDFKYMHKLPLDLLGKQDIVKNFVMCSESNNCIKLKNGKLYTCTRPAAIFKFNEFFNQNLEVETEDYIDIYEDLTSEDILKRLAKPIPFCRYCDLGGRCKDYEWEVTEHKIEEYT